MGTAKILLIRHSRSTTFNRMKILQRSLAISEGLKVNEQTVKTPSKPQTVKFELFKEGGSSDG